MEKLVYQGENIPEYAPAAFEAAMKEAKCLVIREVRDTAQTSGIYAFDRVAVKY